MKDYVTLTFKNGSILDVVGGDGTRGLRRHSGLLDELRDADETEINEVVLPLLNVARRLPNNTVNPKEPNTQQLVMTSAGSKMHFSYAKLIDMFENSIIDPHNSFVITLDYRIPLLHNLISRDFVNKIKTSPSFNEESFAREYGSIWSGSTEESWFDFDKMQGYRKIKNPETHQKYRDDKNCFYLLSVDVGRISDQTICCVFRVNIRNGRYYATLVNLYIIGRKGQTKTFQQQAIEIKRIIKAFNPKEVVIDTNGLNIAPIYRNIYCKAL